MTCSHRPIKKIRVIHIAPEGGVQVIEHCLVCELTRRHEIKAAREALVQ